MEWTYLLLLIPALPLAAGDFRRREVAVVWLAALFAGAVAVGWSVRGLHVLLLHTAANLALLSAMGLSLAVRMRVRRKSIRDLFDHCFGAGDAVMLLALTPLFGPVAYVRFLIVSCVASLVWWGVRRPETIPLAGFMALVLGVYSLLEIFGA